MKLPLSAMIVGIYLAIAGVVGLAVPLLGVGPEHPEFTKRATAFKAGAYTREVLLSGAFIIAGIGILLRRSWARKLGVFALAVGAVYGGYAIAWGLTGGPPSRTVLWSSLLIATFWNAIWIGLLCRKTVTEAFSR